MKIGILFTAYNCDSYIDRVFLHLTEINLLAGINFFIYTGFTKADNFLNIVAKEDNVICHEEKLTLSI